MANQIYCKHCGKLIDADSSFYMHCGGAINSNNKTTPQANKQDVSFIRQLDILGGKFLIGIINFIKWCGRTFFCLCKFVKKYHKILILIIGVALVALAILYCIDQEIEERGMLIIPAILLLIITLYFSYCRSIKIITTLGVLLVSSYSIFIYFEHKNIYGSSTTFFDTIKREFYWITPNFTIPDHATEIKNRAFKYCELLSNVTIGNSVTSIGEYAFESCCGLKSITIPNCVRYIGRYAFCRCNNLTSVYCKATIPPTVKLDLVGYGPTPDKIYVPTASVETYKAAKYWSKYSWCIVGYDF